MYAKCRDCGSDFWRDDDQGWKRLCIHCWRASKDRERGRPPPPPVADPLHIAIIAELDERLSLLIQVAHPDRHAGSPASTKATQWLLSVRDRLNHAKVPF